LEKKIFASKIQEGKNINGSFVLFQQWVHNLEHLATIPEKKQNEIIGREKQTNKKIKDAPIDSHVFQVVIVSLE
jgi:deferrochelatase/peroxidase EfeB